ncbi:MAG: threonine ammonia-lyase [Asticcacaulis sp.]
MTVTFDDIQAAATRLSEHLDQTPCPRAQRLSRSTGQDLWVKFETHHFTASFKERGALNRLLRLTDSERQRGVFAASAGNHAQGLAWHGQRLGIPVTIVMPKGTPFVKVEKTRGFGATVILEGQTYDEAFDHATRLCSQKSGVYVPAFDDPDVIAGQGTIAIEMLSQAPDLDTLVIPIGGGGLIAGMAVAAKTLRPDIRIVGVEAAMYPSFAARRQGGTPITGGSTIAEGIAVKTVGELPFRLADPLVDELLSVEEAELERAIALYANVEKTVAEGAGAAGLAAALRYPDRFTGRKVGLVLCGGNIDTRLMASVLQRELVREKRLVTYRILGDDRPGMLSQMASVIGSRGGNIVDVAHNRLTLDVPAKGAEFDIMVETQDARHAYEIGEALRSTGYALRID